MGKFHWKAIYFALIKWIKACLFIVLAAATDFTGKSEQLIWSIVRIPKVNHEVLFNIDHHLLF